MVASAYGTNISLSHLRKSYKLSKDGMSLYDITKVFYDIGFTTNVYELDVAHLGDLKLPAILFWNNSHFVVLEAVGSDYKIIDPAFGRQTYTKSELGVLFSGVALEVDQKVAFYDVDQEQKPTSHFSWLNVLSTYPTFFGLFFSNILMLIVVGLLSFAVPKLFPLVLNDVLPNNDVEFLTLLLIIFGAVFLAKSAALNFSSYIKYQISRGLNQQTARDYYALITSLPVNFFERRTPAQAIRYIGAVENISIKITDGWLVILISVLISFVFGALLLAIDAFIGGVLVASCIMFMTVRVCLIQLIKNVHSKQIIAESKRNQSVIDTFNSIVSSKINGTEYKMISEFSAKQNVTSHLSAKIRWLSETGTNLHTSLNLFQGLVIAYLGTKATLNGSITPGDMIAIVLFKDMFMQNILESTEKFHSLRMLETELEHAEDVLECSRSSEIEAEDIQTMFVNKDEPIGDITISDLCFAYSSFDTKPIIDKLSFLVPYGSKCLIRGRSGCGKSTLLRLIATLDSPDSGSITYNGMTAQSFGLRALRDKIAIVGIDDRIENATLIENIVLNTSDIDAVRVKKIAKLLELDFINSLPAGYHTFLGQAGVKLSMGQQQRIYLARALYKEPQLLILDEPTSHLDPESSSIIKGVIQKLGCTVIVVSHDENESGFEYEISFN
ncbi:hypothetical protein ATN88_25135 [Enterovibrio coralii]|uniref:ABC transporter ATP-binding protein n=2 Tax=Enterovibrio coralii TaxID=294935 RepID=A0A135IAX0_9GAMM|nr:hypothetical protein ATN88_25135 [Enterovibrio coralii]